MRVDAFAENGSDSTALAYAEQTRKSRVTSVGWQAAGRVANVRPFARVALQLESKDDERFVTASSVTLGGRYAVQTLRPDRDYLQYQLGASADFDRWTAYVMGAATSGRSDGNAYSVTAGVRVPF